MNQLTRIRALLVVGLLLAAGRDARPMEPVPDAQRSDLREEVRVVLHQVDFLVLDRQGRPVTDLRRADVRLWEDGVEQPILDLEFGQGPATPFGEAGSARRPADSRPGAASAPEQRPPETSAVPGALDSSARRWIVLLFDVRNLSYASRERAGRALHDLVAQDLRPSDRIALMVDDDELRIVEPFTTRRQGILSHLEQPEGLSARQRDLERRLRDLQEDADSCREGASRVDCTAQATGPFLMETSRETEASLDHLEALLRSLAAIPDRKILFYVSEGFLLNTGDVASAAVEHAIGQLGYSLSAARTFLSRDLTYRLDRIYQLATETRTGFYPINGTRRMTDDLFAPERRTDSGPENPAQARTDPFEASWQQVSRLHRDLARSTGGVPVFQRDPSREVLARQLASSDGVYTASYHPTHLTLDRRRIKIKVARSRVKVLYRDEYRLLPSSASRLEGQLSVEQASYEASSGLVRAKLAVGAGSFALAPESDPATSMASLFFDLVDAAGRPIRDLYEVIAFPRSGSMAGPALLERPFALKLPAGSYTLRVDVRDVHGPARGSFSHSFSVGTGEGTPRGEQP